MSPGRDWINEKFGGPWIRKDFWDARVAMERRRLDEQIAIRMREWQSDMRAFWEASEPKYRGIRGQDYLRGMPS